MRNIFLMLMGATLMSGGTSVFTERIDDAKALYLGPVSGDATAAIQAAVDRIQETTGEGILFLAEGRYTISRTVFVWQGVRVIGYGKTRPVMVLADNTPGYEKGVADMFFYAGFRMGAGRGGRIFAVLTPPGPVPAGTKMGDANPGTFYSAMSNIDFEVGEGNAGGVAVRFHAAQHAYLSHMDFRMGSGLAGIHDAGNIGVDLRFFGGRYGILTRKPSAAWQFTLVDSYFEGQREAAIRENEAQLTLVHNTFKNVPTAVAIDRDYSDQLWIKDAVFENVSGPAIVISNEQSRLTQVNAENVVCRNVPVFAKFRESGKTVAGKGEMYEVKVFGHGLMLAGEGAAGRTNTKFEAAALTSFPAAKPNAIASLPPVSEWTNLRSLGAKGDGKSDDTAVIKKAVAEHRVIYAPMGYYVVSDTIALRPDTVLIALHPDQTQLALLDGTAGFQGIGTPRALLETPMGGANIVSGIGLNTNGVNARAVAALWRAGKDSLMDDVRFLGGHGTNGLDGKRTNPYNNTHTADPELRRRWDGQYPSLWVLGGGGTFSNLWTPSTFAQTGLFISDTTVPGRVFQVSSEHHVRNEIAVRNAANWELYSLQTEGEVGESATADSLSIENSHNVTVANYHGYRVVRSYHPFPYAVRIAHSYDIRFRNVHVDNNSSMGGCYFSPGGECRQLVRAGKVSYADAIVNETTRAHVRDREFAWLDVTGKAAPVEAAKVSAVLAAGAKVRKVAGGFFNVSGGTADAAGNLYFTDRWNQRIYRLDAASKDLSVVRDNALDPVNLTFDQSGNLIVVSPGGDVREVVYSFKPGTPADQVTVLERKPAEARPGMTPVIAVDYWVNGDFTNTLNPDTLEYITQDEMFRTKMTTRRPFQYVSADGSVYIPANEPVLQGEPFIGHKWTDILMPTGLVKATPGKTFYATNEGDQRTYSGKVNDDGTLCEMKVFAYQGGESLAQDKAGQVLIAAGEVYVYSAAGTVVEIVRVPERPTHLVFGGKDGRTLFILSHHSVYSVRVKTAGL